MEMLLRQICYAYVYRFHGPIVVAKHMDSHTWCVYKITPLKQYYNIVYSKDVVKQWTNQNGWEWKERKKWNK